MNDPLLLFSGDHPESFSPGVAQNEDEEAEKKKQEESSSKKKKGLRKIIPW